MNRVLDVFVVSDATGATAESVVNSVLLQFAGAHARIRRFPFVRTVAEVQGIVEQAAAGGCIVIFTLVLPDLRTTMLAASRARGVEVVDLMGPLVKTFSGLLHDAPTEVPGARSEEAEAFQRVTGAIHYTLRHDDGLAPETLDEADVIILGVSRTGKTPTSIYLSCEALRVANVPVVQGIPLPPEVVASSAKKVGFRISVERLVQLRSERPKRIGMGAMAAGYSGEAAVLEELEYCEAIYRRVPGIRTIDVTTRSIEEVAAWIKRQVL